MIVLCQGKEKDVEKCPQKISGNTHKKLKVSEAANSASSESLSIEIIKWVADLVGMLWKFVAQ